MTIETLEKIAKVLNVPLGVFFDDNFKIENLQINESGQNLQNINQNATATTLQNCEQTVAVLTKEIAYLKEINELLKQRK
jgi:transcriptional regulator with XRE-family HTH domain